MVKVSIISLIYRSSKLADWVYESICEFTPMLKTGEAEFFFVANDPTDELVNHLVKKKYPLIVNRNEKLTEEELFAQGYGSPEYICRVYKGYNQGILHAKGTQIVLINSDNYFSPDWLENLLKYSDYKSIVTSTLVEPGHSKFSIFPGALHASFGNNPDNFEKEKFLNYADKVRTTGIKIGGAYMPCLFYKDIALYVGLYPNGNIAGKSYDEIIQYGDEKFYEKLWKIGISHITSKDSIVYHLKEGERDDIIEDRDTNPIDLESIEVCKTFAEIPYTNFSNLNVTLQPSLEHSEIMRKMSPKVTIILTFFENVEGLLKSLDSVLKQTFKNIEIILVNDATTEDMTIVNRVVRSDNRMVIINMEKRYGLYYCKNIGLEKSAGDYITFLNCGDILLDNKIETQLNFMKSNDVMISKMSYIKIIDDQKILVNKEIVDINALEDILLFDAVNLSTLMMRKSLFSNQKLMFIENNSKVEDLYFIIKLLSNNLIYNIDAPLTIVDHHNINDLNDLKIIKNKLKDILNYMLNDTDFKEQSSEIYNLCTTFIVAACNPNKKFSLNKCQDCDIILNSRLWRITEPFRKAKKLAKLVKIYGPVVVLKNIIKKIRHK